MKEDEKLQLVTDPDVLTDDYIPLDIPARESQIKDLTFCMSSVSQVKNPINAWLYGKPGTGKTSTCKFLLKKLESNLKVQSLHVNCWEAPTFFTVFDKIIKEFKIQEVENLHPSKKFSWLNNYFKNRPLILILDNINQITPKVRDKLIYYFLSMGKTCIIAISNNKYTICELDEMVQSKLNAKWIEFEEYSENDIIYILNQRIKSALAPDSCSESILYQIKELANGDARVAIQTLKNAALIAEQEKSKCIMVNHVKNGFNSPKHLKKDFILNKLQKHHRILYNIIKDNNNIQSGALRKLYLNECKKININSIAIRTQVKYLNTMIETELIRAERALVKGKIRCFCIS